MKNLFQTEYRIAAVYSLAALHAGGRIIQPAFLFLLK